MAHHNDLGKIGENIAANLLIKKGYIIRERNWRIGKLEIDIIAELNQRIVIVEVKTRSTNTYNPLDAIDRKKVMRLIRAAKSYLTINHLERELQFDIVTVVGTNSHDLELNHYADAIMPPLKRDRR